MMRLPLAIVGLCLALSSEANSPTEEIFAAETYAASVIAATTDNVFAALWDSGIEDCYPFETANVTDPAEGHVFGEWIYRNNSNWGAGFFAGLQWHFVDLHGSADWLARAQRITDDLAHWPTKGGDHDIGFNVLSSYGRQYAWGGDEVSRQALITAAGTFSNNHWMPAVGSLWSFNFPWGPKIEPINSERLRGPIRQRQNVIIDTSMNIELLFTGAKLAGEPEWFERGRSHMRNVVRDMVREDGGTIQVVDYWLADQFDGDGALTAEAGTLRGAYAWQGFSPESTWSRGQGWAIHGLASAYRETGDALILQGLLRAADYYLREMPADGVPPWDFNAPDISDQGWLDFYQGKDILARDTSAAAIAAAGLLELSRLLDDREQAQRYFDAAETILVSLSTPEAQGGYLSEGTDYASVLTQGTYTFSGYSKGLIWGEYYFLQALQRYRELVRPAPAWSATGVAGMTDRWARWPQHLWTVRNHAGKSALAIAHGQFADGLHGESLALALLDTPVGDSFTMSFAAALDMLLAERPDSNVVVIFDWVSADRYAFVRLGLSPESSGVFQYTAGTVTPIGSAQAALAATVDWQQISVERTAQSIIVRAEDTVLIDVELPGPAPASSLVGIGSYATAVAFAELEITPLEDISTFAAWAERHIDEPLLRDPLAIDPASGQLQLLRFIHGDANLPAPLRISRNGQGDLLVASSWRKAGGVQVRLSESNDLSGWSDISLDIALSPLPDGQGNYHLQLREEAAEWQFYRLNYLLETSGDSTPVVD
jgi:unsaturated chondroitin disaccharide hydrolase